MGGTGAVLAIPMSLRATCVAHSVGLIALFTRIPRADAQGYEVPPAPRALDTFDRF